MNEADFDGVRYYPQQGIDRAKDLFQAPKSLHARIDGEFLPVLAIGIIEDLERADPEIESLFGALVVKDGFFAWASDFENFQGLHHLKSEVVKILPAED